MTKQRRKRIEETIQRLLKDGPLRMEDFSNAFNTLFFQGKVKRAGIHADSWVIDRRK